jgi:outer membrane receptor for ferrienterochelin and colicin
LTGCPEHSGQLRVLERMLKSHYFVFILILLSGSVFAQDAAVITGSVRDKANNEAILFAPVQIQGTTTGAVTDENGEFRIENLKPGLYNLEVSYTGYKKAVLFEVEVTNSRPAVVTILLEPQVVETKGVEIVASTISNREESPVSVRTIGTNEIKRNPGGNRDISRAIRALPGVAAIPSFRNDIIIRGGAANENRFYIDGIEIPNINHFATQGASGGPVGLINVDLIQEVEFYSGAFPATRGNALSSVLEFGFKDPRRDKTTANFVVGSSDIGVTLETPTSKNSGLLLSVRRSYLQGLFSVLGLPFLPTYNDFNAKWKWDINERNKLTVIGLGALDQFDLNLKLAEDSTSEDFVRNQYLLDNLLVYGQWNYTGGIKWDHYREKGRWSFILSTNKLQNEAYKNENNDENLPRVFEYKSSETEHKFRTEYKLFPVRGWKLTTGVNLERAAYTNDATTPVFVPALDSTIFLDENSEYSFIRYGFFAQSSKALLNQKLTLSFGLRLDGNEFNASMRNPLNQFSPRIAARYTFAPQWSINMSTGIYYQLPPYTVLGFRRNDVPGNPDALYVRNAQVVAGVEYDWNQRNSIITVEGFYKDYSNYPVSMNNGISLANLGADFGVVGKEDISSVGLGRAYGAEFLLQQRFYKGWYGILSYTYVRSEFTGLDGKYVPSSWDSRHLVSVTGGKRFGKNWEIGGRYFLSGGLPFTPDDVSSSMIVFNWDRFGLGQPDWSQINSQRIKAFQQLDIRIDKKWFFSKWSLNLFFDVQNVLNSVTPLKPALDVQRDEQGNPVIDPNDPSRYLPNFLNQSTGSTLPSIGIIVEL